MRKSTVFISAVLTTFALVILYGVVSAYRNLPNAQDASALTVDTATLEPTTEPTAEPTAARTSITPEQAAQLAAQVVGNNNLLSAESSNLNGTAAYKITFTNNDIVYIGLDGQVLSVQIAPVVVNVAVPVPVQNGDDHTKSNNTSNSESHDSQEHDD